MDRLIVMDRGRIVETGSHAELVAQGGIYARLWAHQSGGFLGETDEESSPGVERAEARVARWHEVQWLPDAVQARQPRCVRRRGRRRA